MTSCKIILHGGYSGLWEKAGCDLPLFQKLIDAAKESDNKIMISFLAHKTPSDFPALDEMLQIFNTIAPDIQIAVADRTNFSELLPKHKVLFLQGGNSLEQHQAFTAITKENILDNKFLIAGSSSGAMMLCTYGFAGRARQVIKGKDIVNIAFMAHANSWPIEEYLPILQAETDAPVLLLNENEMVEMCIKTS
jgi:hypothetical protein